MFKFHVWYVRLKVITTMIRSQQSLVSTVTRVQAGWLRNHSFLGGTWYLSLLQSIHPGSGDYLESYAWLPGSFILWGKVARAWTWPLTSSAEVKSVEPYFHSPICLHVMYKDNFIFTFAAVNIRIHSFRFVMPCSLLNEYWNWRHLVVLKVGTYLANWTISHLRRL
jgi:hypothetical protein